MSRTINFFDGAASSTTPTIGNVTADNLAQYANDAAYEAAVQGAPAEGNIYYNTTLDQIRYYANAAWHTLTDTDQAQTLTNKTIDGGSNTLTNLDGDNVVVDAIAGLTATDAQAAFAEHQGDIDTNATNISGNTSDIADIRTTTGTSDGDTNMGLYTGTVLTDNTTTKANIQELGTQVDTNTSDIATLQSNPAFLFQGSYNASTNTPTLVNGTGTTGHAYKVSVAGTQDFGAGNITFIVGDLVFYDGSVWDKDKEAVNSVAGKTGTVTLVAADITDFDTEVSNNTSVTANTAKVSADGSINTHSDVDTTTVAPVTNDVLTWDGTDWVPGAGGSGSGEGGINYIQNPDAETDQTNVTTTANVTESLETTTPLVGTQSHKFQIGTGATTADYFEFSMNDVDLVYLGRELQISFWYETDANYSTDDVEIRLRNVDGAADINIRNDNDGKLVATGAGNRAQFFGKVQLDDTDNTYALRGYVLTAPGTASNITMDKVKVSPDEFQPGAIVTKAEEYSLTIGGSTTAPTKGTTTTDKAIWYRHGDKMIISYNYVQTAAGSAGSGFYKFPLPAGYTIDTNKTLTTNNNASAVGSATVYNGTNTATGVVSIVDSSNLVVTISNDTLAPNQMGSAFFQLSGATINLGFTASIPIEGWEASNLVSTTDRLFSTVDVRGEGNGGTSITANTTNIDFSETSDNTNSWNGTQFTAPKSGKYKITGSTRWSTNIAPELTAYVDGVSNKSFGFVAASTNIHYFSGEIFLNKGEVFSLRSSVTATLTNDSPRHWISISSVESKSVFGVHGETELIESASAGQIAYAPTLSQWGDLTSITLTPGEWDLDFKISTITTAITAGSIMCLGVSSTSGNTAPGSEGDDYICATLQGTGRDSISNYTNGVIITVPTTYYLKTFYNTAVGTTTIGYRISARKIK